MVRLSPVAILRRNFIFVVAVLFVPSLIARPVSSAPVSIPGHPGVELMQGTIFFERNEGQAASDVLYLSHGLGYTLFLTRTGATVVFSSSRVDGSSGLRGNAGQFKLRFVGANPQAEIAGVEKLPGQSNYFSGSEPSLWQTHISQYAKVRYSNLYPGIDLIFYVRNGQLEYDFVVAPGAKVGAIHWTIEGANVSLAREGEILFQSTNGEPVRLKKPFAYQSGDSNVVHAGYSLHGEDVAFVLGKYDHRRSLVIDPALAFSTLITSACCLEDVTDMAVDASGIYLTGSTNASAFPATANGTLPVVTGDNHTFVVKLDPSGSQVIYSSVLSSSASTSIAVDASGSAYVSGVATVPPGSGVAPFPLTAGVFSGSVPAGTASFNVPFAAKLSPDGSQIVYSTLLLQPAPNNTPTGSPTVTTAKIAVDTQGALYITGHVTAYNPLNGPLSVWMPLPVTQGAFQTTPGTLFAMKVSPNASGLIYSTYIDGTQGLNGSPGAGVSTSGIAMDSSGDAFLTGTARNAFPTTPGVYEPTIDSTYSEAFVMELDPNGDAPVYSTFLGSSGTTSSAVAIDPQGEAVIVGYSFGPPVTSNAFCGISQAGAQSGFVAKLNPGGTSLVYATTLCGGNAGADSVALDSNGAAYVVGNTGQPNTFPLAAPIQSYFASPVVGNYEVGLKLDTSGTLVWSTFLGRYTTSNIGSKVQVDPSGAAYFLSIYGGFPTTPNAIGLRSLGMNASESDIEGLDALLKIAPSLGAAVPLATPLALSFPTQNLAAASAPMDVQLGNFGDAPMLPLLSITGDFSETDNCSSAIPGGQKCDVNVVFTPTASGSRTGALVLSFGEGISSQTIPLAGSGTAPSVTSSPTSLSFGVQSNGSASPAQQVTVTNTGNGPLLVSGIQTTSQFAATNTCGGSIVPAGSCTVQVTFTPNASGPQSGTLTITDNAPNSPQTVALAGNQPASFTLSAGGTTPLSVSVTPGQTANYNLSLSGSNGFAGSVSFICSGAPTPSTCSVTPNPVTISGTAAIGVAVSIATQAASAAAPIGIHWPYRAAPIELLMWVVLMTALLIVGIRERRRKCCRTLAAGTSLALLLLFAGCGGGPASSSQSPAPPANSGTPTGQYTIVIMGTSNSTSASINLNLTVN